MHLATGRSNCEVCSNPRGPPPLLSADTGSVIKIGALHISQLRVPFDGARRGSVQVGGRVAQPYSVVRTRDRVAGAGYACSAHTVCRSFPKISSALSVKACGRSRSAKRDGGLSSTGSDAATESCFSIRGNRENEFASFQGLRHGKLAISSQQSRQKTTLAQWVRNSSRATSSSSSRSRRCRCWATGGPQNYTGRSLFKIFAK